MVLGHVWLLKAGFLVNCCSRGASDYGYAEGDMIWKHSRALGVWSTAALSAPPAVYVAVLHLVQGLLPPSRSIFQAFPPQAQMITCELSWLCELGVIAAEETSLGLRKLKQQEGGRKADTDSHKTND